MDFLGAGLHQPPSRALSVAALGRPSSGRSLPLGVTHALAVPIRIYLPDGAQIDHSGVASKLAEDIGRAADTVQ
jgi:hypothetical protein